MEQSSSMMISSGIDVGLEGAMITLLLLQCSCCWPDLEPKLDDSIYQRQLHSCTSYVVAGCLRMHVVQGESVGVLTSLEPVIEILLELAQFNVLPPDEGATATT